MNLASARSVALTGLLPSNPLKLSHFPSLHFNKPRSISSTTIRYSATLKYEQSVEQKRLVVVGGGAAGVYGAIRAKTIAPDLNVVVIEKGKPLSKVKISGGGRCNVTNGHCFDSMILAENYPRGHKELKGAFFNVHGPADTMSWFSNHGVNLKTEDDGRVFPVSNSSSSIIDCLISELEKKGVEKRSLNFVESIEADYILIASGSSRQGHSLAAQLGHRIVDPVPSLFTFKVGDSRLAELSGVTFNRVKAKLKLEHVQRNISQLTQVGPMLITHWGLSGPVILRLSAWGARDLFSSRYNGEVLVDFTPDLHVEDMKSILNQHKIRFAKQKMSNSCPSEFGLIKRFWKYILEREGLDGNLLWASCSNNSLNSVASLLKQCAFSVSGKGQFKDEFVTAGGVPLSEVLNVDGVTGGFNFQNAWSGGFIAGTSIGELAVSSTSKLKEQAHC